MSKMGELFLEMQEKRMEQGFLDMEYEMHQARAEYEAREEYEACQEALPAHKRDGYAEKMADCADMLRDRMREDGW